jgi:hypothetical protein
MTKLDLDRFGDKRFELFIEKSGIFFDGFLIRDNLEHEFPLP